ncbi:unnamed protein product [Arabis nemorensis]|uniref:Amidase domain-containing protein n=1 Tax=Arabis nemorensis TaxID=586526 RepID=A0A565BAH3_9BRAS|nr:unnamed protein product [Arabis nemorensis]
MVAGERINPSSYRLLHHPLSPLPQNPNSHWRFIFSVVTPEIISSERCDRHCNRRVLSLRRFYSSKTIASAASSSSPVTTTTLDAASVSPPQSQILTTRRSLLSGEITASEIAKSYLSEPQLKCFLHVSQNVLRDPQEIDERIAKDEELGPLAGVLIGVKDNICTEGMPSTAGSCILEGLLLAKPICMNLEWEASAFQVTANPWDLTRVPGGSAAAVAAKQCMVSLGSDTGGSVRQPASFCGVVGLKPTYGRGSRFGLMAYASSLDLIGCFGSTVADAGMILHAISWYDRFDATSSKQVRPLVVGFLHYNEREERFGLIPETLEEGIDSGVSSATQEAASHLEALGCVLTEIDSCVGNEDVGIKLWLTSSTSCMNVFPVENDLVGRYNFINDSI